MQSNIVVNSNQNEKESDQIKISPLGVDEINSVIESFKNSSFNQENLYKSSSNNFVKKTLFDLAKESEKISSEQNQSETDVSSADKEIDNSINISQETIK